MAGWILVPCLVQLRNEFNALAPHRDKASDGSIGDVAHEERQSDHNRDETGNVPIRDADKTQEVHAIDVDTDLRVSGLTMEHCVQFVLTRCRSGKENRLRYIIYNRRIWSASNGWRQASYSGANPHDKHAHFSSSYDSAREADTRSWHLEDLPVALTDDDKKWIKDLVTAVAEDVWAFNIGKAAGRDPYTARGAVLDNNLRADTTTNQQLPKLAEDLEAVRCDLEVVKAAVIPPQ